jgi:DNA polymerase III subunit gamma/tau
MEYTVMARRFRPQSFGEVVGQENIAQALRNAIASGRVAHAYLFTGARGVGKTSTARILAKSLNCPNVVNGDPCNQCEICRGVSTGSDIDVIEIDGASNRGIDEIRDLRATVNVKAMRTRFKIYIIDEVHMLTTPAFNALLKTLEEPPPNVKFIFCTTDPQKVPETILSRCQRFDFGTISTGSIGQRLAEIAAADGVQVDPQAIQLVARRAAGSMRDSQSLFDQLLAFGGKTIGTADVHRLLGTAPDERLVELAEALLKHDVPHALAMLDAAVQSGVQVSEFADQLVSLFRDLTVICAGARELALLSVAEEQRTALGKLAGLVGLQTLVAALQILAETKHRMKGAAFGRILLELALVRIAVLDQLDDLKDLVARFRQGGGGSPAPASVARTTPANPSRAGGSLQAAFSGERSERSAAADANPGVANGVGGGAVTGGVAGGDSQTNPAAVAADSSNESGAGDPAGVATQEIIPFEPGREAEIWSQVVVNLSDMAKTSAKNVSRTAISGPNSLVLMFPKRYHLSKQYLERSNDQVLRIEKVLERVVGRPVKINLADDDAAPEVVRAPVKPEPVVRRQEKAPDPANDVLVQRAVSVFGATVVKVETAVAPVEKQVDKGTEE